MTSLFRIAIKIANSLYYPHRRIATSACYYLKQLEVKNESGNIIIKGVTVESPRAELLVTPPIREITVNNETKPVCNLCALGLDLKHTDVLILSQFVRSDGCMLPKRITGLCSRQQKKVTKLVAMAQKAGLMINLTPGNCKKDPKLRYGFKKFNTYFDETTIFGKKPPKWTDRFKYRANAK